MELHSKVNSAMAKRMWNVLRVTFFMIRKGLISKRKLIMDMNLMMKRGKLMRKTLTNLMFHHHHHQTSFKNKMARGGQFGIQEYEFSCSNSPNPVFFHMPKRKHHYFPCINHPEVIEEEGGGHEEELQAHALIPKTPEYTFNFQNQNTSKSEYDTAAEDNLSPLLSPFAVRISNYSSEDENDDDGDYNGQVDNEAEEFIKRFYEQLRAQSRMQLLQYQDA